MDINRRCQVKKGKLIIRGTNKAMVCCCFFLTLTTNTTFFNCTVFFCHTLVKTENLKI